MTYAQQPQPAVIVHKKGFLASLATGFFGLLTTGVVCLTGLGAFALHTASKYSGDARGLLAEFMNGLPAVRAALPPALADAISDRRAIDYLDSVEVKTRLVDSASSRGQAVVIEVSNRGSETISMMSLNVVAEDARDVPIDTQVAYAATPLAIKRSSDWMGPILPGSTRRFVVNLWRVENAESAKVEICDLRVSVEAPKLEAKPQTTQTALARP
ncbi:MAG: hypothetical protein AMXMBFR47_28590 [Planctomycetota bacterium]